MRKILTLLFTLSLCVTAVAQNANYQKAVARYKNHQVTATAVKTTHRAAVSKDQVTRGTLTMRQPAEVGIVMEGGQDALLMRGSEFTMTQKGKKHTTSSKSNPQFATFQAVFESILSGGAKDISRLSDLTMRQNGDQLVLTITPQATDKKSLKRMMFTSFVLTINTRTSQLQSLRMNEKAGNYTEYTFSNFQFK
ncbi:MAG: outer membrane lipoprotein carrier protein LolA [Prevotella sp.]|nr:outer membrane lipoprotein carrier protein LolA [Prevotella sp.]